MRASKDSAKLLGLLLLGALLASPLLEAQRSGGGTRTAPRSAPTPRVRNLPGVNPELAIPGSNRIPRYPKVDKRTVTFTSESQLVLVPVVVRDKKGQHISGLDRDLFTVYEDGKPRRVTQFEEIRKAANKLVQRPQLPAGVYTNVLARDSQPRQLAIIMLDLLNTPLPDQARAKDELLKYLGRTVNENTPTALLVLSHKGVRVLHDFAVDPRVLAATLRKAGSATPDSHTPAPTASMTMTEAALAQADPRVFLQIMDSAIEAESTPYRQAAAIGTTMEAFQHIAQSFAGVPGRKALIWATASFPFTVMEDSGILGQGQPSSLYERTMQMLANANIAVYPVDVRGLVVFGGAGGYDERTHPQTIGTMEMFAQMTGGRAFYNRNDLDKSFAEATDDSEAYYLLGYQLDTTNTKSGWRKLKVEVSHPDVRVRARNGFFVTPVTQDPEYSREVDIWNALQSPLEYTSLPFVTRWTEIEEKGDRIRAKFEIVLAAQSVEIDASKGNRIELEFLGVARDPQGESRGQFSQTFVAKLKPEQLQQIRESGITYNNVIEVPRGQFDVRFVVRDNNSGRTGSVRAPLTTEMASRK